MTLDLILIGFGNVARRFAQLLDERRSRLVAQYGVAARIVGIATRHGRIYSTRGLDAAAFAAKSGAGLQACDPGARRSANRLRQGFGAQEALRHFENAATLEFLGDALERSAAAASERRLIVVETTTLDIGAGEPAISHVLTSLSGGAHVVTANKGPAAFAYQTLSRAADRANRRFLFEGAVMDGIPVFNLARETLRGVEVLGFRGIVNTTTNYILNAMEQGQPFDEALVEMQAMGVAEADPSLDTDGWDAAAKTAALANVLMQANLTPLRVERCGIHSDLITRVLETRRAGRRLKLIARAGYEGSRISARVTPEELPADDLLAGIDGQQNALILHTDLLGEIAIVQRGSGLTQTAYALLSDVLTIAKDLETSPAIQPLRPKAPRRRSR